VAIYEAAGETTDLDRALRNLAGVVAAQKQYDHAFSLYRRTLELREQMYGTEHSLLAPVLKSMGALRWDQGDCAAAEPLMERALAVGRDTGQQRLGEFAQPLLYLADCLVQRGAQEEAERLLQPLIADETLEPKWQDWIQSLLRGQSLAPGSPG
jgi:tetratricopeptide (TPR) repeat protein